MLAVKHIARMIRISSSKEEALLFLITLQERSVKINVRNVSAEETSHLMPVVRSERKPMLILNLSVKLIKIYQKDDCSNHQNQETEST